MIPRSDDLAGPEDIQLGRRRFVWYDGFLWWRTYRPGGFDGYRSLWARLPCGEMAVRVGIARRRKAR